MTQKKNKISLLPLSTKGLLFLKRAKLKLHREFQPHFPEKIFFLHLPKCGGTSIDKALRSFYQPFEICHLDNASCVNTAQMLSRDLDDYRRDLLLYYLGRENKRYLGGHFAYSKKAHLEFGDKWYFITVLRHPVDRWFSHYFYNRYKTTDELFRISEDLSTFVDSSRALVLGRQYVMNLTEGEIQPNELSNVSDATVTSAIKALNTFSLVGCLEHLDVMKKDFKKLFGVKFYMQTSNVNPLSKDEQHKQISVRLRKRVEEICEPDLQIYNHILTKIGKK